MKRKLYLETFGCQMNVLDSELVLGQLRAQGYESTEDRTAADVILYDRDLADGDLGLAGVRLVSKGGVIFVRDGRWIGPAAPGELP